MAWQLVTSGCPPSVWLIVSRVHSDLRVGLNAHRSGVGHWSCAGKSTRFIRMESILQIAKLEEGSAVRSTCAGLLRGDDDVKGRSAAVRDAVPGTERTIIGTCWLPA